MHFNMVLPETVLKQLLYLTENQLGRDKRKSQFAKTHNPNVFDQFFMNSAGLTGLEVPNAVEPAWLAPVFDPICRLVWKYSRVGYVWY